MVAFSAIASLGAKYCTPEIDTSEIIVEFQWHIPMDVQWLFTMLLHSLSDMFQRIITFAVDFQ